MPKFLLYYIPYKIGKKAHDHGHLNVVINFTPIFMERQ